jgi:hypothetical protein
MANFHSRKKLIIGIIGLLVIAGVVVGIVLLTGKSDSSKDGIAADKTSQQQTAKLSPVTVLDDSMKYNGQETTLEGTLFSTGSNYYLAGQANNNQSKAIKLDLTTHKIDVSNIPALKDNGLTQPTTKVPSGGTTPTSEADKITSVQGTFIVTGTVQQKDAKTIPVFVVTKLELDRSKTNDSQ